MHIPNGLSRPRLFRLIKQQLQQGTSAHELSMAIVLGVALGTIPVFGFITAICAGLAAWLRLNITLSLAVLYAVMPLQLLLFVPFIRLGELMFSTRRLPLAPENIVNSLQATPWDFMLQIWQSIAGALGAWLILSVMVGGLLYQVFFLLIRRCRA